MIITTSAVDPIAFAAATGWELKPEGACKDDRCVPLADAERRDVHALAARLRMPVVRDEAHGLWAVGPEAGGRALTSTDLVLPDWRGEPFRLSSLRGQKVLLVAWASW
jgi:hypothetical protein